MNNLNEIFILNEQLSKKLDLSLSIISESLGKSKFKYASKALLLFIPKSGYLMSSILSSCEAKNIYSSSILFRSLIEHSFRQLYIFTKALNDDDDTVGRVYYQSLKANEDLESVRKIINYNKAVYPEKAQINTKGEHNKILSELAEDFRIERIFYYLIKSNNRDNELFKRYKKEYLLDRLIEYTNMSSSVHGGPFGELALLEIQKDTLKLENTLNRFVNDTFMLYKNIVEATYLFAYLMDDATQKYYEEIRTLNDTEQRDSSINPTFPSSHPSNPDPQTPSE